MDNILLALHMQTFINIQNIQKYFSNWMLSLSTSYICSLTKPEVPTGARKTISKQKKLGFVIKYIH